jgi:hypothetical protein
MRKSTIMKYCTMANIVCNIPVLINLKTAHVLKLVKFRNDVDSEIVEQRIDTVFTEVASCWMIYAVHVFPTFVIKYAT